MLKKGIITLLLLSSCEPGDQKMCDCLDSGEKLNRFSAKMLRKEATDADLRKMQTLRADKKKKCAAYQTMSGEEMLKRKQDCIE